MRYRGTIVQAASILSMGRKTFYEVVMESGQRRSQLETRWQILIGAVPGFILLFMLVFALFSWGYKVPDPF